MFAHEGLEVVCATSCVDIRPLYGWNYHTPSNVQISGVEAIWTYHPYEVMGSSDQIYNLIWGNCDYPDVVQGYQCDTWYPQGNEKDVGYLFCKGYNQGIVKIYGYHQDSWHI